MALIQSLVTSDKYGVKCPYTMNPKGICIHNTANDASAKNEISYMKSNNNEVSFHVAIDDIEAIQAIPFNRNAWAAGDGGSGSGNRSYIHIEICYSKSGGSKFTAAEKRAAKEVASILKSYNWGIGNVKKHQDFSGKYCPHRTLDMGWQRFLNMVSDELKGGASTPTPAPTPSPSPSGSYTVKITADTLNVRTGPGTNYSVSTTVTKGQVYTIVEDKDGWGKLKSGAGWISLAYTDKGNATPAPPVNNDDVIIQEYAEKGYGVPRSTVNVRNKPSVTGNSPVATYSKGERFNYDKVVITNAYTWVSYVSGSGVRRYIAVRNKKTNERYVDCY